MLPLVFWRNSSSDVTSPSSDSMSKGSSRVDFSAFPSEPESEEDASNDVDGFKNPYPTPESVSDIVE